MSIAVIREDQCIGCTKCIQACPVDAIMGASKFMHTVIADVCTGCERCIPPCPVDCIDLIPGREKNQEEQQQFVEESQRRTAKREGRLARPKQFHAEFQPQPLSVRQAAIQAALERRHINRHCDCERSAAGSNPVQKQFPY